MSAKNDITGDAIASKANSKSYRDNYENIFAKKATEKRVELDGGICNSKSNDGCRESQLRKYAEGAGVQGQADQEQAVEQEPVAWGEPNGIGDVIDVITDDDRKHDVTQWSKSYTLPLYAHPPKRKPLSDSVIERIIFDWDDAEEEMDLVEFARAIEAAHSITGDEHAK